MRSVLVVLSLLLEWFSFIVSVAAVPAYLMDPVEVCLRCEALALRVGSMVTFHIAEELEGLSVDEVELVPT